MPKRKQDGSVASVSRRSTLPTLPAAILGPRRILTEFSTLDQLVDLLETSKKVVVVTGAGISVSCGIPDFRSQNGVYDLASRLDLGLSCPEDLFDLEFFKDDPEPFFKFAKALYPGNYVPSPTHRFIKALEDRGKLLRNFTQNIDGLEAQVGLKKYVACHGSFLTATCLSCKAKCAAEDIREEVMRQEVPRCSSCGKGVMKPNITFFGEKLPNSVKRAVDADHKKADLLLVLGTSLNVQPVSKILQFMPPNVPQVLVNRELIRPPRKISDGFDLHLLGDCDDVIEHLCARLGWQLPLLPSPPPPALASATKPQPQSPLLPAVDTAKEGKGGTVTRHPRPAPAFVPPNSYIFSSAGAAWAGLEEGDKDSKEEFVEVVTCDGCDRTLTGAVHSCLQCFDFDLCGACHRGGLNDHAQETGHSFKRTDQPQPDIVVAGGGGVDRVHGGDARGAGAGAATTAGVLP